MELHGFFCPQCKAELEMCKPVGSKIFGLCRSCNLVVLIEDYQTWRKRMDDMRPTCAPSTCVSTSPKPIPTIPIKKPFNPTKR